MIIAQLLRPNDAMQIRLHEFLNQVNLGKFIKTRWAEDVKDGDNVFVLKVAKKFDLAEGAETEHRVIEWGDSLDGDFALCWGMNCRAKGQLATLTYRCKELTRRRHMRPRQLHPGVHSRSLQQSLSFARPCLSSLSMRRIEFEGIYVSITEGRQ